MSNENTTPNNTTPNNTTPNSKTPKKNAEQDSNKQNRIVKVCHCDLYQVLLKV